MVHSLIKENISWEKIKGYANKAGKITTRPVLMLYSVLKSPTTPKSDKLLIISALSYLIMPIDFLSAKRLPIIGWIDEIISIAYAYEKVCKLITPEIEAEVESHLDKWFPENECGIIN